MIKVGDMVKVPGHRSNINGRFMACGEVKELVGTGKQAIAKVHAGVMGLGHCELHVAVKRLIPVKDSK